MAQQRVPLLANFSGTPTPDGSMVVLTVETKAGEKFATALPAGQLGGAISFLMKVAQQCSVLKPTGARGAPDKFDPVTVSGIEFGKAAGRSDAMLFLQLGPIDLAFQVARPALLASLARLQSVGAAPAPKAEVKPAPARPPPKPLPPRTGLTAPKPSASAVPKPKLAPKRK